MSHLLMVWVFLIEMVKTSLLGRMDSFSPVFTSELNCGNYFSALEMLSEQLTGERQKQSNKSLTFLLVTKLLAIIVKKAGIVVEVQNVISEAGKHRCSLKDGVKLAFVTFMFTFKKDQLSYFKFQVQSLC